MRHTAKIPMIAGLILVSILACTAVVYADYGFDNQAMSYYGFPLAPAIFRTCVDTRELYAGRDLMDKGISEYAQKIFSSPGKMMAFNYVINGHEPAGFASVAFPADYGISGVMTFAVSHWGRACDKDPGGDTAATDGAMKEFNPDPGRV